MTPNETYNVQKNEKCNGQHSVNHYNDPPSYEESPNIFRPLLETPSYLSKKSEDLEERKQPLNLSKSHHLAMENLQSDFASTLPERPLIDLEFIKLGYAVQNHNQKGVKNILHQISGKFSSGQLTAIMGPSGAGKSTLMNILAGYRTSNVSGTILVNGKDRTRKHFRCHSCYIMQEDSLLQFLTVMESMNIATDLKLGNHVDKKKKKEMVTDILAALKLQETTHTMVQNLSGGEKKRLSIALEMVNNPPVMFFDEPTSGLDSQNSLLCVSLLKALAREGRTIICTIHQPSAHVFETFDHIYAMADGQCIYTGTVDSLVPFLSSFGLECPKYHNLADFVIEVASGHYGPLVPRLSAAISTGCQKIGVTPKSLDLVQMQLPGQCPELHIEKKDTSIDMSVQQKLLRQNSETSQNFPASFPKQCYVLFNRTFKSIIRDKMLTQLRIAAHLIVGVFIGLLYYQAGNEASSVNSSIGGIFFNILFLLFTSMMPTINTFPLEMPVLQREHLNHWYSLKSYYIAKTMADLPFQIIFPVIYVAIVYFMTDLPVELFRFLFFLFFTIMTSLVAQSVGLTIGAAVDIQQSVFCGPVSAIPALLFSGFFVSYNTIPKYMRWMTYLSYLRYGYEGSLISIYGFNRDSLQCSQAFCHFKHPNKILELFDIDESFFMWDIIILTLYFIVVRVLGYFVLKWKLNSTR